MIFLRFGGPAAERLEYISGSENDRQKSAQISGLSYYFKVLYPCIGHMGQMGSYKPPFLSNGSQ